MEYIISAIIGFLTGIVASLIAPWVQWGIEKKRSRTEYRRNQIKRWRETIESFDFIGKVQFGNTSVYAEIRPYLDPEFLQAYEGGRTFFVPGGRGPYPIKQKMLDAITQIEKKWGLI